MESEGLFIESPLNDLACVTRELPDEVTAAH